MIIYSCNSQIRNYEYGVFFKGATFNTVSLPFYCSVRIKDDPVRFGSRKIIGIKYRDNDYQKHLREIAEFAVKEGIAAIALPCPNTLMLQEISSLNETLGELAEEVNIRIILNQRFLKRVNEENEKIISDYVTSNYRGRPKI